ncbi:zona pellucida sperm-binding protein 3-like [Pempheris klunzingeri]|uniref:zona pellucida sperm-binding protein 3-like n=1 Tax=Pempheris klunzingeri TaxID=3127111 RepID=UPI0039803346
MLCCNHSRGLEETFGGRRCFIAGGGHGISRQHREQTSDRNASVRLHRSTFNLCPDTTPLSSPRLGSSPNRPESADSDRLRQIVFQLKTKTPRRSDGQRPQVSLSKLVQVNEVQLENHQANQTEGGAKLQLYKTACSTAVAQEFNWNVQPAVQQPEAVHQETQSFHKPLSWKFPEPPTEEAPRYPPHFELKVPTAADSVHAICGENSVRVEAKKDLLGIGKPVLAADVTLGGCPATGEDAEAQVLVFESELHGCGSQLLMAEDSFTYSFELIYAPSPLGDAQIVRTRDVTVGIQCHYQRKHDVSSGIFKPTWTPFSLAKASEESLYFSLRLMTDDWQFHRPSTEFLLGDMMKFDVSVKQFHHAPLRVFVDSCVATVIPNVDTVPRYAFLGNNGCLFDSQLTGSSSQFLPRSQDDRLQFQVEAFRFLQDNSGVIYITCSLRATAAAAAVGATNKACSFAHGWREASGSHNACSCCDTACGTGSQRHLTGAGTQWEEDTVVGPITVKERPLQ